MPKPDLENDDVEIEIPEQPKEVIVDIEEKPTDTSIAKPDAKKESAADSKQSQSSEDMAKIHKRMEYQARQYERSVKQVSELAEQIKALREATTQKDQNRVLENQSDLDPEIQRLAETNWQKAVEKLAEKKAEAIIERKIQEQRLKDTQAANQQNQVQEWEKSKKKVIERYPTIENESTEEARLLREVYNEDQSLFGNIHGPEIAMYRMEEKMRSNGVTPASAKPLLDRETSRIARASGSAVVGRGPSTNGTKIRLTAEQVKFCQDHKIPQESYAKSLARFATGEGVEA